MKKVISSFVFLFLAVAITAQESNFNQYKYVIVNSKFDFVKRIDGYQTSSLTKFLFNKMGFKAFMNNEELDTELAMNRCNAIYADVKDDSGMFITKTYIELRDCKGKLIFTSLSGTSRHKEYKKAFMQSIREAFQSIEKIGYRYDPSLAETPTVVQVKKEVTPVKTPKVEKTVKETKTEKVEKTISTKKEPVMVTQKVVAKKTAPVKKEVKKDTSVELLYAQPNANGYQLVNTKPEVVFILLKTNTTDKFIIKDKNGTFVKDGNYWLAEYYDNGNLVSQKYEVKFF